MQHILDALLKLDCLYCFDTLDEYETTWQIVSEQVQQTFPGFTLAYAEVFTYDTSRVSCGVMRHVLVTKLMSEW